VIERYRRRFVPTHALYEREVRPREGAHVLVDTRDLQVPRIERIHRPEPVPLSDGVVVLDRLTLSDAETHWSGEDEELGRRFGWYPRRSSLDGVRAFLAETQKQWRVGGARRTWAIRLADTRQLVGGCEARLNKQDSSADLSWWIFPHYCGRGLATRGVQLMLVYLRAVMEIRAFVAFVERNNLASMGVARKVGFTVVAEDDMNDGRPMLRLELSTQAAPMISPT
jgi:RimJ/RimL family protein N-acetyltransferase